MVKPDLWLKDDLGSPVYSYNIFYHYDFRLEESRNLRIKGVKNENFVENDVWF